MDGVLLVLDSVMPSADRAVKPLLDQYRVLCDAPKPLARVPDLIPVSEALNTEFPWFADVTTWILRQLAVRSGGRLGFKIPPLLLLGPPGVGKTSYLQRLAELSGLPFLSLSLAGKSDNRDLAGTARGWGTGHPSRVIALINETRTANPIVLLDEIDKAGGSDHNGRVIDTLLTLLEPASSTKFYDDFLWGHADLSRVSWIATANSTATLPTTLLGRMEVKRMPHPRPEHYPAIVKRALDGYLRREGLDPAWMGNTTPTEWDWLGQYFTSPRLARRATEMLVNHRLTDAAGVRM
jgi:ATP-dependent Lon protease